MIDKNRTYKTRDGREVRIYATDGGTRQPIMGAIEYRSPSNDFWWESARWKEGGQYDVYGRETNHDLIEVRPRIKRTVWLNVYACSFEAHLIKEAADAAALSNRLACVKVEIDCEEGEGL